MDNWKLNRIHQILTISSSKVSKKRSSGSSKSLPSTKYQVSGCSVLYQWFLGGLAVSPEDVESGSWSEWGWLWDWQSSAPPSSRSTSIRSAKSSPTLPICMAWTWHQMEKRVSCWGPCWSSGRVRSCWSMVWIQFIMTPSVSTLEFPALSTPVMKLTMELPGVPSLQHS